MFTRFFEKIAKTFEGFGTKVFFSSQAFNCREAVSVKFNYEF